MRTGLSRLLSDNGGKLGVRVVALYGVLLAFNVCAWLWAEIAFHSHPVLLGTAFLAYSFGLRHAVDADHIAAIDNVTRKLMQEGKRPIGVGFMFSLGHSTIVLLGSAAIAGTALALRQHLAIATSIGHIAGTLVSGAFLFGIAIVNLVVFRSIYRAFVGIRRGEPYVEENCEMLLGNRGFLARILRPLFRIIRTSWHMYPLGALFGLGFDTATEVGVLALSAAGASQGISFWTVLLFPALFAAGMVLVDTTDNILMLGAYGWAFVKPVRKLYYNLTVTGVSAIVALAVGGIEVLGLVAGYLHFKGWFWSAVASLNGNFGTFGYFIIGVFALSWVVSVAVYKWRRFDDLELKV